MKKKPRKAAVFVALGIGFVLLALLGFFVLISPQRSKLAELQKQIVQTQQTLDANRALALQRKSTPHIRVADLFRLTKAMPDQTDIADVLLELDRVAGQAGISFNSIESAGTEVALPAYRVVPVTLIFQGNFYDLSDFLFRLRNLVDVRGGRLDASGRLYTIDSIDLSEGLSKFPQIQAKLNIDAFVYGTGLPAAATPAATPPGVAPSTDTSSTATTPPPSTPPDSAAAAGATG